jgi:alpha-galactosidase
VSWSSIVRNFDKNDVPPAAGPGHWNDPDYLLIGMHKADGTDPLSRTEERSYFSMWAIQAAPLMLATYPADLDPARSGAEELRSIVLNREAIAVDQDALGRQGEKVREDRPGAVVYSKVLSGAGRRAVLLLNRTDSPTPITVYWEDLELSAGSAQVRDLWDHADLGVMMNGYTAPSVPAHGSIMLLVTGSEAARAAMTGWNSLGGKMLDNPAVVWTGDGTLSVFGRGLDSYLWVRRYKGGAWESSWSQVQLPPLSTPPAFKTEKNPVDLSIRGEPGVVAQGNTLHLVALGADLPYSTEQQIHVYHSVSSDGGLTWSTPENLGGNAYGRVAPVSRGGDFDILGRGWDGEIWRTTYVPGAGWTGWNPMGGCIRSGIAAASTMNGTVHVAVIGCDDAVWHGYYQAASAISWERVGGANAFTGTPAVAVDTLSGRVNLFARSRASGELMQSVWNGSWSSWLPVAGCSKSGVGAASRPASIASATAAFDLVVTGCNSPGMVSASDPGADAALVRTAPAM